MITSSAGGVRKWHTIYSCTVVTVSLLSLIGWIAFGLVWLFFGAIGFGDGAMSNQSSPAFAALCIPLLYLAVVSVSALPLVNSRAFVIATIFGHIIFIAALYSIAHAGLGPMIRRIIMIGFVAIDVLWLGLYCVKFRQTG